MRHTDNDGITENWSRGQRSGIIEYSISCCEDPELVSMEVKWMATLRIELEVEEKILIPHQDYSIEGYYIRMVSNKRILDGLDIGNRIHQLIGDREHGINPLNRGYISLS